MICDLLIVHISGLLQTLIAFLLKNFIRKSGTGGIPLQPRYVFMYFLGNRSGEHSGIGSGISHQLFLIQFLNDAEGLIRADLKQLGTVILKFRKIVQKRSILDLLLLLNALQYRLRHRLCLKLFDQLLRVDPLLESILLV